MTCGPSGAPPGTRPTKRRSGPARQIYIGDAIDGWMTANGCAGEPDRCPPVVLIAAEGGGNRAAFYTATMLGALLDGTRDDPDGHHDFGRSIFAMSGVSGGALGITRPHRADGSRRCAGRKAALPDRIPSGSAQRRSATTIRRKLASLPAEPCGGRLPFANHPRRDLPRRARLPLLTVTGVAVADRAALLEQAIEQHYNVIVSGERTPCGGAEIPRSLPSLRLPAGGGAGRWLPLLLLNATSVDSGRQIMASDLDIGADSPGPAIAASSIPSPTASSRCWRPAVAPDDPSRDRRTAPFPGSPTPTTSGSRPRW